MKLLLMLRRRWRMLVWAALVLVIVVVLLDFSNPKSLGTDIAGKPIRDSSHLQVIRKRLNKSSSNSSSLNYVDWDAKDGAFDPEIAKQDPKNGLGERRAEERGNKALKWHNDNEEDENNDNYNLENFVNDNFRDPEENSRIMRHKNARDDHPASTTNDNGHGGNRVQGHGGRVNYSIPEVDDFVKKFRVKYQSSKYAVDSNSRYLELLIRLTAARRKGSRLPAYGKNRGTRSWEKFHSGIHQHYLYDPYDASIDKMLDDFGTKEIVSVEQKEGGTQIKLILTFENEGQVLFKPMRYGRAQETLPDHFYFADFERHNAEIAAFHLDKALGFHRVPPTLGRLLNVTWDIQRVANKKLVKTFFISPAGNWCFHGSCSYYCDSSHPVCGHPMMLEGSLAAFLPSPQLASRKTWRNPWKRSYSKHRKAYWEIYDDLCDKIKQRPPYSEGRRLLDVLDMSVFDFLTGNLDRHHYETFQDFGNDTFLLHLDNGRAFGKSQYDCISCLAPVRQCCMIRLSTITKLVKLYTGPDSLSQVMRLSMSSDPLNPILIELHLDALDRRISKILHVVNGCLLNGMNWDEVIIDDGVT